MYYSTTKKLSSKNQKKKICRGLSLALGKGDLCRGHGANGPRQRKLKKNTPASAFPSPLSAPSRRLSSLLRTVPTPTERRSRPRPRRGYCCQAPRPPLQPTGRHIVLGAEPRDPHSARRGRRRPVAPQPHRRLRSPHRSISPSAPSPSRILLLAVLYAHGAAVLGASTGVSSPPPSPSWQL